MRRSDHTRVHRQTGQLSAAPCLSPTPMVKTVCAAYPKGLKMRTVTDGGAIRKERRKFNSWITRLDVDVLRALASLPYGDDGELKISSLAEAVEATESGATYNAPDPILAKLGETSPFAFNEFKPISAPSMRKEDGEYRTNQLAVVAATTASSFYKMIAARRRDCLAGLSTGYLASRVFFIKLWIFLTQAPITLMSLMSLIEMLARALPIGRLPLLSRIHKTSSGV